MMINNPLKKCLVLLSFMILSCLILPAPEMFASEEKCSVRQKICFQWSFIAYVNPLKNPNENNVLLSGDKLKTNFTLYKPCFLYFIHHGPGDEVTLLYPYALPHELPSGDMPITYRIPEKDHWTLDDNAGKETFYLIAASMKLKGLESLLTDYNQSDASNKVEAGKKIIQKIENFNQKFGKLTAAAERIAERPATWGGSAGEDPFFHPIH